MHRRLFPLSPFSFLLLFSLIPVLLMSGCRLSFTEMTQTAVYTGPPTPVRTPDPAFAPERGQGVFNGVGQCSTCHSLDGSERSTGPGLLGIASRVPEGVDPADFFYRSIVHTKADVTEGWRDDLMPANYIDILSSQQISDLVTYMLTLP